MLRNLIPKRKIEKMYHKHKWIENYSQVLVITVLGIEDNVWISG